MPRKEREDRGSPLQAQTERRRRSFSEEAAASPDKNPRSSYSYQGIFGYPHVNRVVFWIVLGPSGGN